MDSSPELISLLENIRLGLFCVFGGLIYIGSILTLMLRFAKQRGQTLILSDEAKQFQIRAQEMLRKAEYAELKDAALSRQTTYPGDAVVMYYLGMAHLRSKEYVDAKACFERAASLDSQWKKVCESHLSEIAVLLKASKPTLVQ